MQKNTHSRLRVFVSHKHTDGRQAKHVADLLKQHARHRGLETFVSDYDLHGGEDWRQRIRYELRRSNMLLLLYTDPSMKWDWCLYEAGLFTRLDADQVRPVVCLYAGEQPPGPLHNVQGVATANLEALKRFLARFYRTTDLFVPLDANPDGEARIEDDEPLNKGIRATTLAALARSIRQHFRRTRPVYPCHRIVLELASHDTKDDAEPPLAAATVAGSTPSTLRSIFGQDPGERCTWGDLVEQIGLGQPQRWAREVEDRLQFVVAGDVGEAIFHPITTTFRGCDGRIYCPEIYRVDVADELEEVKRPPAAGTRATRLLIIFDSLEAPSVVGDTIFNLIRVNYRFRDEIMTPYGGRLRELVRQERRLRETSEDEARAVVFGRLDEALGLIDHEADIHDAFDEGKLALAYGPASSRWKRVQEVGQEWLSVKADLSGAIADRSEDETERCLEVMSRLNWDFSLLTARQHLETIERERWERPPGDSIVRPADRFSNGLRPGGELRDLTRDVATR